MNRITPPLVAVFRHSLRRRAGGLRLLPALGVALVPALVAAVYAFLRPEAAGAPTPFRLYTQYLGPLALYAVLPFVSMLLLLPVLGELYDRGAMGYFVTRPVPRWVPLLGLYGGAVAAALPVMLLGAAAPALLLQPAAGGVEARFWVQRTLALGLLLWLGTLPYGALCLFLGVWSRKAVLWALALLVGWGSVAGSITGPLRALSPHRYLAALLRSWLDLQNTWSGFYVPDPDPPGTGTALLFLGGYTLLFLVLAWAAVRRRDIL